MIGLSKEHPWRSGALVAFVVLAGALAAVMYARRGGERAPAVADEHAGHGAAVAAHGGAPTGFAPVALDPAQAAAMGLTTQLVGERDFTRKLRTVGVVTVDETRTAHVHARVRGWIEGFHVQYVGRKVQQGEPLISLYSQEVYAAQLELASIVRSPVKSPELLDAARKRLALWEVPRSLVEQVEATGEPQRTFPVLAPRAGVVVAKQAFDGLYIDPSLELYTITDLARVWVLADIYEADVPLVKTGSVARLTIEGQPAAVTAKVAFLYPTIDEPTRTRKVRFEIANADGSVLPGAFVTAELELASGRGLAVPESAVIRTGERAIVFVVHGGRSESAPLHSGYGGRSESAPLHSGYGGRSESAPLHSGHGGRSESAPLHSVHGGRSESAPLHSVHGGTHAEPREVTLGPLVGDHYRIDAGLAAGEHVATGAQFLLDSESRLRATSGAGGGHAGHAGH